jgi:SSS family solute:Na+ symporter
MGGTAQVIVPTLAALFWERSNSTAMVAGLLSGITLLCFLSFACHIFVPYAGVFALLVNALVFVGLSLVLPSDPRAGVIIAAHKESFNCRHQLEGKDG